jgi:hypothetical protein
MGNPFILERPMHPTPSVPFLVHAVCALALGVAVIGPSFALAKDSVRESRTFTEAFDALYLAAPVDLELVQGAANSLILEGEPDALAHLDVHVFAGALEVRQDQSDHRYGTWRRPHLILTVPKLLKIRREGAGELRSRGWHAAEPMEVELLGTGTVRFEELDAAKLSVHIMGSAEVHLAGTAAEEEVRISGAGDYDAGHLCAAHASVTVAGAGDVVVWATQTLAVSIAGVGDVKYYGRPNVARAVAGLGLVEQLAEKP